MYIKSRTLISSCVGGLGYTSSCDTNLTNPCCQIIIIIDNVIESLMVRSYIVCVCVRTKELKLEVDNEFCITWSGQIPNIINGGRWKVYVKLPAK